MVSADSQPDLFSQVPPAFFAPLGDLYAPLYWAVLARLYVLEFEREPFFLVKQAAVQEAEEVLGQSSFWRERREQLAADSESWDTTSARVGEVLEAEAATAVAKRILARLQRCGWFHYEYRAEIGEVLNFYPYAARILETLVRVGRDEQPPFQGYAYAIALHLKRESLASKPGIALQEAKRAAMVFIRELKILNGNILAFTQHLLNEVEHASQVLEHGIERYSEKVLANYHRLKTEDNLYKWRYSILEQLRFLERDDRLLELAAREYAGARQTEQPDDALADVKSDIAYLQQEFESLPVITDDIDIRNTRFSGVAARKLSYLLRQDKRTESQLQFLVEKLALGDTPELKFDVFRSELLADGFLFTPRQTRVRPPPQPLRPKAPIDRERLRKESIIRIQRPFSREKVGQYVRDAMGDKDALEIGGLSLDGDEDYVRLIYAVAYGLEGRAGFQLEKRGCGGNVCTDRTCPDCRRSKGQFGFPHAAFRKRNLGNSKR